MITAPQREVALERVDRIAVAAERHRALAQDLQRFQRPPVADERLLRQRGRAGVITGGEPARRFGKIFTGTGHPQQRSVGWEIAEAP